MSVENHNGEEFVSKSAKKRQAASLQKLGEELMALPAPMRSKLNLPAELEEALNHAASIREKEAARRQRQYIGRLMRNIDPIQLVESLERQAEAGEFTDEASRKFWKKVQALLAD